MIFSPVNAASTASSGPINATFQPSAPTAATAQAGLIVAAVVAVVVLFGLSRGK